MDKKKFIITFRFNNQDKLFFTKKSFIYKEEARNWFLNNYKNIATLIKIKDF